MVKVAIYNQDGKILSSKTLNPKIFEVESNPKLIAQVVHILLVNRRHPIAHTKTRGEVRGGGRKPYRQKGTGQARAGSTRSPIWTGGGVAFGPRNLKSFKKKLPQKMNQKVLKSILSEKIKQKKLIIVKEFKLEKIATKQIRGILEKLPIQEGKILVILPKIDANVELSMSNLPYLKIIKVENINTLDLLKYDYLLTTSEGIEKISNIFKV